MKRERLTEDNFMKRVTIEPKMGCWLWNGCIHHTGYGHVRFKKKVESSHRVSWMLHNGEIPNGLFVCHKCDVRACVNPKHLFLGTLQENMQDCVNKNRYPKGSQRKESILKEAQVVEIKKMLKAGIFQKDIAKKYSVAKTTISGISRGARWKHV